MPTICLSIPANMQYAPLSILVPLVTREQGLWEGAAIWNSSSVSPRVASPPTVKWVGACLRWSQWGPSWFGGSLTWAETKLGYEHHLQLWTFSVGGIALLRVTATKDIKTHLQGALSSVNPEEVSLEMQCSYYFRQRPWVSLHVLMYCLYMVLGSTKKVQKR